MPGLAAAWRCESAPMLAVVKAKVVPALGPSGISSGNCRSQQGRKTSQAMASRPRGGIVIVLLTYQRGYEASVRAPYWCKEPLWCRETLAGTCLVHLIAGVNVVVRCTGN